MTTETPQLQGNSCPLYPHTWTEGDKNPGLIFVIPDAGLIANGLTVKVCLDRPTTVLNKTLTNLDEERAHLSWVKDTDLIAGVGQLLTAFVENGSGERTHLVQFLIDVRERVCT